MTYYRRIGDIPPKRHTQFRTADGALYAEELMGQDGFSAASALLYHRHAPTALLGADDVDEPPGDGDGAGRDLEPNRPLLPRHLRTGDLDGGGDLVTGRTVLLANDDLRLAVAAPTEPSGLYRNATGDELVYLRRGALRLESSFGVLDCREGDYVVVPTGTTHRWVPTSPAGDPIDVLVVEAQGHVGPPARYLSARGQFLEHSPYCERDLHAPTEPLLADDDPADAGPAEVLVRHRGGLTRYRYAHHPFDVVGWDGCLYPYRFSIHDFEPITGRVHQPPPVHQTFAGPNFVVCSFVPRKLDYHPLAVPVPYNHSNTDSDEVLYYCAGNFTSRRGSGIAEGSISLHPAGFTHGPQPGSVEAGLGEERTEELAVMVDTFRPLQLAAGARACEDPDYAWSWAAGANSGATTSR
ncbi:MAG TPA: homogentisate 1,2-dioxygenase [Acidimicrobiales bacterium]|nr:homogentisate 1,2-dioxygenase [Acidimicrobiales bacterium]